MDIYLRLEEAETNLRDLLQENRRVVIQRVASLEKSIQVCCLPSSTIKPQTLYYIYTKFVSSARILKIDAFSSFCFSISQNVNVSVDTSISNVAKRLSSIKDVLRILSASAAEMSITYSSIAVEALSPKSVGANSPIHVYSLPTTSNRVELNARVGATNDDDFSSTGVEVISKGSGFRDTVLSDTLRSSTNDLVTSGDVIEEEESL